MADSHETSNMYPNLSTAQLNVLLSENLLNDEQHFRLKKNK